MKGYEEVGVHADPMRREKTAGGSLREESMEVSSEL